MSESLLGTYRYIEQKKTNKEKQDKTKTGDKKNKEKKQKKCIHYS